MRLLHGMGFLVSILGVRRRWDIEQLPCRFEILPTRAIGEQAVVADAMKSLGQNVDQESTNEFAGLQRHHLELGASFGAVVNRTENPGDFLV